MKIHSLLLAILLAFLAVPWQSGYAAEGGVSPNSNGAPYPPVSVVIDVTRPPYLAKGDGQTDDTNALQRALNDHVGQHHVIYFPAGTYLISKTLTWPKNWEGRENWGKTFLRGQSAQTTTLRLKDATFGDEESPQAMMWCGGFGSADWFHNYVEDLTFHVGEKNPGATALQFYSNNSGAVRNCRFIAPEGSGVVGLDLGHRDMNGPLLVRRCEVTGFRVGIHSARAVNSQTFEHIRLSGQMEFGIDNQGQPISIRGLVSDNAVPAVRTYGTFCLIEANLVGRGNAAKFPAIINYNGGRIFLRDITTTGYKQALADMKTPDWAAALRMEGEDKPGSLGPTIDEYCSQPATSAFPSKTTSLRLKIEETPETPLDDPATWANVDDFGADPTGQTDSSAAIQKAMDSGATTIFLPGKYALKSTVVIGGKVRRIVGVGGMIDYTRQVQPDFRLVDGESPVVFFEHLANVHGGLEIDTSRTVVLKSVADCDMTFTPRAAEGKLYFEDVVTHDFTPRNRQVWARQFNVENEGTHIRNDGGSLWILGYKTERGGTLLETINGGRSEVLGGFSYTTTAGKLAPMFVTNNSSVFAYFTEICFNGDPFVTLIQETRGDTTKQITRDQGSTTPYVAIPLTVPD